jgi:hypothetical protein
MSFSASVADERVLGVEFSGDALSVSLRDGRVITVPLAWYPRLLNATPEQLQNWKIAGGGYGLHWPDLDEDLSTEGLLRGGPHRRLTLLRSDRRGDRNPTKLRGVESHLMAKNAKDGAAGRSALLAGTGELVQRKGKLRHPVRTDHAILHRPGGYFFLGHLRLPWRNLIAPLGPPSTRTAGKEL